MQNGALDHPLETGGGGGVALVLGFQALIFLIEILLHHLGQIAQIHAAMGHHLGRVRIVDQGEQQMLQRGVFVAPLRRVRQRGVEGFFEALRETRHQAPLSVRGAGGEATDGTVAG